MQIQCVNNNEYICISELKTRHIKYVKYDSVTILFVVDGTNPGHILGF